MNDIPERLVRLAQQFEDQHAPQNMTILMREAAAEIERLQAELNDRCPNDAMDNGMSPVEAAVFHVWGERCSDFEPMCLTCKAWAEVDQIAKLRTALASVETYLTHGGASRSRIAHIARAALAQPAQKEE